MGGRKAGRKIVISPVKGDHRRETGTVFTLVECSNDFYLFIFFYGIIETFLITSLHSQTLPAHTI